MDYLKSIRLQFTYYKQLGEKSIAQLSIEQFNFQPDPGTNSIAMIVQHLWGNMLSRWTDFKSTDGEKPWRNRDDEFTQRSMTFEEYQKKWQEGWDCLFNAIDTTSDGELNQIIYIRNEGHTILEAFNRQLSHYCYHVGQIALLAKIFKQNEWQYLSIPPNQSAAFNQEKFAQEKTQKHFTEQLINKPTN